MDREFKERIKNNQEHCFCGEKFKIGRDGNKYCPRCKLQHGEVVGWITYKNSCTEVVHNG